MRINTKCSVALHCLVVIYEFAGKRKVTSELLAESTGCNAAAIRSILLVLQKDGIISVARGVGGASLNRVPEQLTVWDVYSALEPDGLEHFIGLHPSPSDQCPVGQQMHAVLKTTYQEICNAVKESMMKITLQHILDNYHKSYDTL
ncbi:MAG: Rrf2 family transcriptional regulator [Marvinbryantia sp.]|jgi:DNA-binding IscR family transcriptional regulator